MPEYFGLCFETEAPNRLDVWPLVAKAKEEHSKVLKTISRLWTRLFRVPLPKKHVVLK